MRRTLKNFVVCLGLGELLVSSLAAKAPTVFDCAKILTQFRTDNFDDLQASHKAFIIDSLLPMTGPLLLQDEAGRPRVFKSSPRGFEVLFEKGPRIRIEWIADLESVDIEVTDTEHSLRLPEGGTFDAPEMRAMIQNLLIGHPLNPYFAPPSIREQRRTWGQPALIYRPVQKEAIELTQKADDLHIKKLLIVGPTAVGKTPILLDPLLHALKPHEADLHLVVGDQEIIVTQAASYLKSMREGRDFELIQWGAGSVSTDLSQVVEEIQHKKKPLILVTTIQTLRNRLQETDPQTLSRMRHRLRSIRWDETHHAGASTAVNVIETLINHKDSTAVLRGVTSTPLHRSVDLTKLFDGRAYYLYLDKPQGFLEQKKHIIRPIKDILKQFEIATSLGDISPVSQFFFVDPEETTQGRVPFWTVSSDGAMPRYVINPKVYPTYLKRLRPILLEHRSSFYTANTKTEADALAKALRAAVPELSFEAYHSGVPNKERVWRDYVAGKINCLISVHMLDEAVDHHPISLWINGTRGLNPRMLVQRAGRTARHSPVNAEGQPDAKYRSSIVSIVDVSPGDVEDAIEVISAIQRGFHTTATSTRSSPRRVHPQKLTVNRKAVSAVSTLDPTAGLEKLASSLRSGFLSSQQQVHRFAFKSRRLEIRDKLSQSIKLFHSGDRSSSGAILISLRDLAYAGHKETIADSPFLEDVVEDHLTLWFDRMTETLYQNIPVAISDFESSLTTVIEAAIEATYNAPQSVEPWRDTPPIIQPSASEAVDDLLPKVAPALEHLHAEGRELASSVFGLSWDEHAETVHAVRAYGLSKQGLRTLSESSVDVLRGATIASLKTNSYQLRKRIQEVLEEPPPATSSSRDKRAITASTLKQLKSEYRLLKSELLRYRFHWNTFAVDTADDLKHVLAALDNDSRYRTNGYSLLSVLETDALRLLNRIKRFRAMTLPSTP